jgi:hypothetical protein
VILNTSTRLALRIGTSIAPANTGARISATFHREADVSYDGHSITRASLALSFEARVEMEARMIDKKLTFEWEVVTNHPDHDHIERVVTRAARGLPGHWVVSISPSSAGWRMVLRGAGPRSLSMEWNQDVSAEELAARLHEALSPRGQ